MPNPYVVKVDRNAFWNQWRSTPEPALNQERPPEIVEASLYQDRWASSGPYQGTSFYPFAYSSEPMEPTPIQQPLSVDLPTAPSDVDIQGIGEGFYPGPLGWLVIWGSAAVAGYHGYKRNKDSLGWGAAWAIGGYVLPVIVPAAALLQGYAKRESSLGGLSGSPEEHLREAQGLVMDARIALDQEDFKAAESHAHMAVQELHWTKGKLKNPVDEVHANRLASRAFKILRETHR